MYSAFEPSGPFFFGNAEQQRDLFGRRVSDVGEAFLDRGHDHVNEFRQAAPRLFQWNLAANNPFAAFVHETRFGFDRLAP